MGPTPAHATVASFWQALGRWTRPGQTKKHSMKIRQLETHIVQCGRKLGLREGALRGGVQKEADTERDGERENEKATETMSNIATNYVPVLAGMLNQACIKA